MDILLTNDEMVAAYGIEGEFGTMERVCRAQLKKVVEWLSEDCKEHDHDEDYLRRRRCYECSLVLDNEAGL